MDALGVAAELHSVAHYSPTYWPREQQAEPACHAAIRYTVLGRPLVLLADILSCFPSHHRPSFSGIQEFADKNRLHTTDDGIVLLVRQLTPPPPSNSQRQVGRAACLLNDERVRIYVSQHMFSGYAGFQFDSFLPPRHHVHARAFLVVDWYEHLHPEVASPPPVSSTENLAADGPLAHHLDAPT